MSRISHKEKALLRVQQLGFMTDDLRLFLNMNPGHDEAFCALKKYIHLEKEARREYEELYGSLTLKGTAGRDEYDWADCAWPWEMEE